MNAARTLLLLLWLAVAAGAQETCAYQGRLVTDLPSEQAEVELLGPGAPLTTRADAVGLFRFEGLSPGAYQLTVTFADGPVVERYVTVRPNGRRDEVVVETPRRQLAGTLLWSVLAALLGVALGSGILLYGRVREHAPPLPWGARPRRGRRAALDELWPMVAATGVWCLSWLLVAGLAPELQPFLLSAAAPVSAIMGALLGSALVLVGVSRRPRWTVAVGTLVAGVGLTVLCRFGPGVPDLACVPASTARLLWLGVGVGMLAWTTGAGWLLSLGCRQTSYVVMAALVGAVLDIYLVFFGHTGEVMTSGSSLAAALRDVSLLPWPVLGSDLIHGAIGWGDFVFLALFLAAAQRFDLGLVRNFWAQAAALTVGFTLGHVLSQLGSGLPGLPALPFMAAFLILANRGKLRIQPEDRRRIAWFVGLLTVALAARAGWRIHVAPHEREEIAVSRGQKQAGPALSRAWAPTQLAEQPAASVSDGPLVDGVRLSRVQLVAETISERPIVVRALLARAVGQAKRRVLWLGDMAQALPPADMLRLARAGYTCLQPDLHPALDGDWNSDLGAWPSTRLVDAGRSPKTGLAWHQGLAVWRCVQVLGREPAAESGTVVVAAGAAGPPVIALAAQTTGLSALLLADVGATDRPVDSSVAEALERCSPMYRDAWRTAWSPERWAPRVTVPVLHVASSNQPDWRLPSVLRLHERLGGRKAFRLLPNAESALAAPTLGSLLADWLADGLATRAPLQVVARGSGERLSLGVSSVGQVSAVRLWISVGPWSSDNWPGRWWSLVEPRSTSTEVNLAAPAQSVAVAAQAVDAEGHARWSTVTSYQLADLHVLPRSEGWQSPELALAAQGQPVFRLTPETDARGVALGLAGDGAVELALPATAAARSLGLITNHVQALRRLGGQARALVVDLDAGRQGGAVTIEIGAVAEGERRWFAATVTPSGPGRQRLAVELRRLSAVVHGARLDWSQVDALRLRTRRNGSDPLRIHGLSLADGDESVHEVSER